MRIVQITPGSGGGFYCENCLRDIALVRAMRKLGHDVIMAPLYLPLQARPQGVSPSGVGKSEPVCNAPIFFGGVNVYLQQKLSLFRKTPRWIDRLFDSPGLLGWVAGKTGMTSARDLGMTTISMLRGEQGRQIKELDRLVEWLSAPDNKADVICLSNILLVGLARRIKEKLNTPLVCLLQDEHGFLDGLARPYSEQAWQIVAERAKDIDAFLAVSKYYGDFMQQRLGLDTDCVRVGYAGISLEGYGPRQSRPQKPTIGFLSQTCSEKGLDTLVEAFITLKKNEKLKTAKLRIAGGHDGGDKTFLKQIRRRLDSCDLSDDVEFLTDFDRDAKQAFLSSLSLLCVPEKQPVAYGLYVLEALAAGVPAVQPAIGVFPELLETTGGGLLYDPDDTGQPARSIERLLLDPDYAEELGRKGREVVQRKFDVEKTARETVRIYEEIIKKLPR